MKRKTFAIKARKLKYNSRNEAVILWSFSGFGLLLKDCCLSSSSSRGFSITFLIAPTPEETPTGINYSKASLHWSQTLEWQLWRRGWWRHKWSRLFTETKAIKLPSLSEEKNGSLRKEKMWSADGRCVHSSTWMKYLVLSWTSVSLVEGHQMMQEHMKLMLLSSQTELCSRHTTD